MSAQAEPLKVAGKYFGPAASSYDQRRMSEDAFHKDQFLIEHILRGAVRPGHNVLDVACGTNRISGFIRELGGSYHGIDISADMVVLAQKKDPQSDIQVADARAIPHADAAFDLVMSIKFLKWLPDAALAQVLEEISRVLKPNGLALLQQKVRSGGRLPLVLRLRQNVASLLKRDPAKPRVEGGVDIRAADEAVFLNFARKAGLALRFAALTSPTARLLQSTRSDAFYIFEKHH